MFGKLKVKSVDQVWANWEKIKKAEKHGTRHARPSALDGIPKHLPALLRAEKLVKKARRAGLPATAAAPGGTARLEQLDPDRLAMAVLDACRRRSAELTVPRKAAVLAGLIEWFPNAGRRLLARFVR